MVAEGCGESGFIKSSLELDKTELIKGILKNRVWGEYTP